MPQVTLVWPIQKKDNVFVQKYTELKNLQKSQLSNDDNDKAQLQLQLRELKQKYEKMESEFINNKMKLSESLMQVRDMEREMFDKSKGTAQKNKIAKIFLKYKKKIFIFFV